MLTTPRVHALHREAIRRQGQEYVGAYNDGCVDGAVGNAYQAAAYLEGEDSTLVVAARVLRSLAVSHCYGDGNKRVGWAACMEVLALAELTVHASDDEVEAFVLGIADGSDDAAAIQKWLASRLRRLRH